MKAKAYLFASVAIVLWASLATLAVNLSHVPPFWLTGLGLLLGALVGVVWSRGRLRQWRVPLPTLLLGVVGLFGYHFLLFMALRLAPPVQANLVNYLWPLLIVLLAPLVLPQARLRWPHVWAGLMGFAGAALAIVSNASAANQSPLDALIASSDASTLWLGFGLALLAALVWAMYSLLCQRVPAFPTSAIGGFCAVSGTLSVLCALWWEPFVLPGLTLHDWGLIALIGAGALGVAFFAWDAAFKVGDAQTIGVLAFATPVLSTLLLSFNSAQPLSWSIAVAALLIVGAAVVARR